jgi:hypothetical protein
MDAVLDLRNLADREHIADLLPVVDQIQYSISREQFLDALAAVTDYLPVGLPLEYRYGHIAIHSVGSNLFSLIELGLALQTLQECEGFTTFLRGFSNPTQFWDTCFEARVASYFRNAPGVQALSFGPPVSVRGRQKYPEFRLVSIIGNVLVECKRLHFSALQLVQKLHADVGVIAATMTRTEWPEDYCLEVEFLRPEREQLTSLAAKLVNAGIRLSQAGGGTIELEALRAHVRHRNPPFQMSMDRRGLYVGVVRIPGYAVNVVDPRHTPLRAFRGDVERKYRKLLRAAINDARTQLPPNEAAIICIGDLPLRIAVDLLDRQVADFSLPEHVQLLSIWESNTVKLYCHPGSTEVVNRLLGTTFIEPSQ